MRGKEQSSRWKSQNFIPTAEGLLTDDYWDLHGNCNILMLFPTPPNCHHPTSCKWLYDRIV